jgi:hypothetical protein
MVTNIHVRFIWATNQSLLVVIASNGDRTTWRQDILRRSHLPMVSQNKNCQQEPLLVGNVSREHALMHPNCSEHGTTRALWVSPNDEGGYKWHKKIKWQQQRTARWMAKCLSKLLHPKSNLSLPKFLLIQSDQSIPNSLLPPLHAFPQTDLG